MNAEGQQNLTQKGKKIPRKNYRGKHIKADLKLAVFRFDGGNVGIVNRNLGLGALGILEAVEPMISVRHTLFDALYLLLGLKLGNRKKCRTRSTEGKTHRPERRGETLLFVVGHKKRNKTA
jgi:hypothetical protein